LTDEKKSTMMFLLGRSLFAQAQRDCGNMWVEGASVGIAGTREPHDFRLLGEDAVEHGTNTAIARKEMHGRNCFGDRGYYCSYCIPEGITQDVR
jgi:hypothetical protein